MDRSQQVTQAPDGRGLVFAEWGDLDGSPVFALHGTPGLGRFAVPGHSEWLARTVPGAIVRRTGLGHFGDPDADTVERLTWLTGGAG